MLQPSPDMYFSNDTNKILSNIFSIISYPIVNITQPVYEKVIYLLGF